MPRVYPPFFVRAYGKGGNGHDHLCPENSGPDLHGHRPSGKIGDRPSGPADGARFVHRGQFALYPGHGFHRPDGLSHLRLLIAQGCGRTRNIGRYLLRLFLFALLSEIPYDLLLDERTFPGCGRFT